LLKQPYNMCIITQLQIYANLQTLATNFKIIRTLFILFKVTNAECDVP
jgi:hypothetical protein